MSTQSAPVEVLDPFPGRVPWPCGLRPYRHTVRAWHYRIKYWLPRICLWAYVVLPPVVVSSWWTVSVVTPQARLFIQGTVLIAAVALAAVLDLALFRAIFHGREDGPGIMHAAQYAAAWRTQWLGLESRSHAVPHVVLSLHEARTYHIPNFDATPLLQHRSAQEAFEKAIRDGFRRLEISPICGAGVTENYYTLVIIWPLPEPADLNGTIWLLVHLLNNARADSSRITSGYTYWRSPGHVPGVGWHRGDEATLRYVLPFKTLFSIKGFLRLILTILAVLAWPIGILVLAAYAITEAVTHGRYKEFLHTANPQYGDSLDLALLCRAAQANVTAFPAKPDSVTSQHLRAAIHHFEMIVAEALLNGTNRGVP